MMIQRIFGGPGRYYQGEGVLDRLGAIIRPFTRRAGIIIDAPVARILGDRILRAFAGSAEIHIEPCSMEVTRQAIAELAGVMATCDVIVGVGGGKAIDLAKGVSVRRHVPVVTVPTIASNDSPTSSAIAIYDEAHTLIAVDIMEMSPAAVIVDTGVIARAPSRFLRAGIGDAIAKKFEAEGCFRGSGNTIFGTRPLAIGAIIANGCFHQIRAHASVGLRDAAAGRVSADLDALIEAVILLSGVGFENGGLSLAHAMTRGLMRARGASHALHGEHVAYGLRVHLALLGDHREIAAELDIFYNEIGLPRRLADLGMADATPAEILAIAELAMTAPHIANFPSRPDAKTIAEVMILLEAQEDPYP
ncbi:MAG: iron-containing alcohol dehydrogenase [Rhodospirillaceae bacterium]|nr:MAG: iron-containing alcohol dehydrogenase [Rhodospirillaceae bacterium]